MSRATLVRSIERYRETWPEESETTNRFIEFVSKNPDCFERSLAIGHVTGSAWIVHPSKPSILLTHHRKLKSWFQLGGHADGDEKPARVALNEAIEESGIPDFELLSEDIFDIDIHLIPARKNEPEHYHYDLRYLLRPIGSEQLVVSQESLDLQWVELSKLENYTTESSMLRMAKKWIQKKDESIRSASRRSAGSGSPAAASKPQPVEEYSSEPNSSTQPPRPRP